jgi:hypothetical protein
MIERSDLKEKVRRLPDKPGVYLMKDRLGRVIYVGKAKALKKRVASYFTPSRAMTRQPKIRALIDLIADEEVSGKVPGTDLREGVRTLPVLYALEDEAATGGSELATLLAGPLSDADVARALEILRTSDGLVRARDEARERVDAAVAHLAIFGDRPVVTALERLAHYALDRLG